MAGKPELLTERIIMAKVKPHLIKNLLRELAEVKRATNTITKDDKLKHLLWAMGGSAAVATEIWENHQRSVEAEMLKSLFLQGMRDENNKRKGRNNEQ